jgi:hypothetical protein
MGKILNLVFLNWGTMMSKKTFSIKEGEEEEKGMMEKVIR